MKSWQSKLFRVVILFLLFIIGMGVAFVFGTRYFKNTIDWEWGTPASTYYDDSAGLDENEIVINGTWIFNYPEEWIWPRHVAIRCSLQLETCVVTEFVDYSYEVAIRPGSLDVDIYKIDSWNDEKIKFGGQVSDCVRWEYTVYRSATAENLLDTMRMKRVMRRDVYTPEPECVNLPHNAGYLEDSAF